MDVTDLTQVEMSVLLILMAEGRPLKENAEIKKAYGVNVKANHREKLRELGFIGVSRRPVITLELTKQGLAWARDQLSTGKRSHIGRIGVAYALLNAISRVMDRKTISFEDFFTPASDATFLPPQSPSEAA